MISNFLLENGFTRSWIERAAGLHRGRKFPKFPKENFPKWVSRQKAKLKRRTEEKKKVAYFAGCTAKFFFPEVAKAFVDKEE